MSKHHSTVSRREFMKALGLAGAGLGAAAATAPVFHDLDELISKGDEIEKGEKCPWWVKELEFGDTTTEIDWTVYQRYDKYANYGHNEHKLAVYSQEELDQVSYDFRNRQAQWLANKEPGRDVRAYALGVGIRNENLPFKFPGSRGWEPQTKYGDRADPPITIPRYTGTPEENSKLIRAALKFAGAYHVNFGIATPDRAEKFIYTHEATWGKYHYYEIGDYDDLWDDGTTYYHPHHCNNLVAWTYPMAEEMIRRAPSQFSAAPVGMAYSHSRISWNRFSNFMWALGKYQVSGHCSNAHSVRTATNVWCGIGETCRTHQSVVTPEMGQMQRNFCYWVDMPVAPSRPIDFGVMKYCLICKKCAEACPMGAISSEDPTYDKEYGQHMTPGVKDFDYSSGKCSTGWSIYGFGCNICYATCPFATKHLGSIHNIVKAITSTTPIFNSFFRNLDDVFGYGMPPAGIEDYNNPSEEVKEFWDSWWDLEPRWHGIVKEIM